MKRALLSECASTEKLPSLTAEVSAISPGVTLVVGPFGALRLYVEHVLLLALATASAELPVPMPSCDLITSIHSGTRRQLEMIKCSHAWTGIAAYANNAFTFEYLQASTALNLLIRHGLLQSPDAVQLEPVEGLRHLSPSKVYE